jgi:peptidoglycan hydrolase-like protein with peptidoglycan-binding domain
MGLERRTFLAAAAVAIALLGSAVPSQAANSDVAALQVAMIGVGRYPHPVDGITGPWTLKALEGFQREHGLAADGVAGPQTRAALGKRGGPELGARTMEKGDRGWDVASLQFLLKIRGFGQGGLDGGFGANTDAAVRGFQQSAGLAADGVAGSATLAALRQVPTSSADPVRFLRPVSGPMGDGFGYPGGRRHTGIDFPVAYGTPISAAGRGTVVFAGWNSGGYGNLTVIKHRLGWETWYAHQSKIAVSVGQAVSGGETIGYVGSTGRSTGPHLHFETRYFGTPVDPAPRLLMAQTAGGRRLKCRPNADARRTKNTDPYRARYDRCP